MTTDNKQEAVTKQEAAICDSGLLDEKDVRMIRKFCICPDLAMVALCMTLVLSGLFFILEMIGTVLRGSGNFRLMGVWVYLGLIVVFLIAFGYFAISPKLGMKERRWKTLVHQLSVEQTNADYSAEITKTAGLITAGALLGRGDNNVSKTIGGASRLAGTAAAVSLTSKQMAEIEGNAKAVARAYGIDIPDTKRMTRAVIAVPILIMVIVYLIRYFM